MSSSVGRLDLAMSILDTFGNIAYGLKNRFDRPISFIKVFVIET